MATTGAAGLHTPYAPMLVIAGQQTWREQPDDYVTSLTSAASITLPSTGYRLVKVQVEGGTTPGSFQVTPDGISACHFPVGSNGTSGSLSWAVLWRFQGTTLSSTMFAFNGGTSRATLTFSKGASRGPDLLAYRATRFTVTTSATHSTPTAFTGVNYAVSPAVPSAALVFGTAGGYSFYWPVVGTGAGAIPSDSQPSAASLGRAPSGIPPSTTLTPSYTNTTAAGTMDAYVGYDPRTGE